MNNSDMILKTYRDITSELEKPYYVMEGITTNEGKNNILYSSPNLKILTGLSQFELASDSNLFFDSIHPDYINSYIESNKKLLNGAEKDKRIYLIKNKETGDFIPVEELASSRLNKERNCYEIYCSIRSINTAIDLQDSTDIDVIKGAFSKISHITPENRNKIFEITNHFVENMAAHYKMNGCRFYGFNAEKKELFIFADTQNKRSQQVFESTTRIKTKSVIPVYSEENYFYELLLNGKYDVLENKESIINILKAHTESGLIKKLASAALRLYKIKSFGMMPICCPDGQIVGLVTFAAPQHYSEEEKKSIYDYTTTNSFVFTCLLSEICHEQ